MIEKKKTKARGNGQGTVYKRGNSYTVRVVIGWKPSADGKRLVPVRRSKGGFKTRKEAVNYVSTLYQASTRPKRLTLQQLYDEWEPFYTPRVGKSTMEGYMYAFKHFSALHNTYIDLITASDLQLCMDACSSGKRTHENMKCIAGLLWHYAYDRELIDRDITKYLYTGKGETMKREPITEQELEVIRKAVGRELYADYVYCQCFLGFRPGEFLSLKKSDVREEDGLMIITGGSKTAAGRNRSVPVPDAIRPLIQLRLRQFGTDLLFPRRNYSGSTWIGWTPMSHDYYNKHIFKPLMATLGIAEGKTPYCARHTYSDKLKRAGGDEQTKAALMGHTDYAFTRSAYQSPSNDDLKAVVSSIK